VKEREKTNRQKDVCVREREGGGEGVKTLTYKKHRKIAAM